MFQRNNAFSQRRRCGPLPRVGRLSVIVTILPGQGTGWRLWCRSFSNSNTAPETMQEVTTDCWTWHCGPMARVGSNRREKNSTGVFSSSSPKTGCTDTDNSIAWDYSGSSTGDFARDDSAIAVNDFEIVPGTQPKTYFVGHKGENEWRMPDLYIYNKIVSWMKYLRYQIIITANVEVQRTRQLSGIEINRRISKTMFTPSVTSLITLLSMLITQTTPTCLTAIQVYFGPACSETVWSATYRSSQWRPILKN